MGLAVTYCGIDSLSYVKVEVLEKQFNHCKILKKVLEKGCTYKLCMTSMYDWKLGNNCFPMLERIGNLLN